MPAPIPPPDGPAADRLEAERLPLDHLRLLGAESQAFADALEHADLTAPVPGCPDWTARDLGLHVLGVQRFWAGVVRDRTPGRVDRSQVVADPPTSPASLVDAVRLASVELVTALSATPPQTPVWTSAAEKTAGFVLRRQCHEALIHRIDAEQAAGRRTPVDPRLAADGVDELLRVLYGELPDGWTFGPVPGLVVEIRATDTGDRWTVAMGDGLAFSPNGDWLRRPRLAVLSIEGSAEVWQAPTAGLSGTAEALDRWFWHRTERPEGAPAVDGLTRDGEDEVHQALVRFLAPGIRQ